MKERHKRREKIIRVYLPFTYERYVYKISNYKFTSDRIGGTQLAIVSDLLEKILSCFYQSNDLYLEDITQRFFFCKNGYR